MAHIESKARSRREAEVKMEDLCIFSYMVNDHLLLGSV